MSQDRKESEAPVCPLLPGESMFPERPAVLHLTGWGGLSQHRVTVLRETPKRFRVRFHEMLTIKGRLHLNGSEALVPKTAVTFPEPRR